MLPEKTDVLIELKQINIAADGGQQVNGELTFVASSGYCMSRLPVIFKKIAAVRLDAASSKPRASSLTYLETSHRWVATDFVFMFIYLPAEPKFLTRRSL
jgi:hypothetical protein